MGTEMKLRSITCVEQPVAILRRRVLAHARRSDAAGMEGEAADALCLVLALHGFGEAAIERAAVSSDTMSCTRDWATAKRGGGLGDARTD